MSLNLGTFSFCHDFPAGVMSGKVRFKRVYSECIHTRSGCTALQAAVACFLGTDNDEVGLCGWFGPGAFYVFFFTREVLKL